MTLQGPGIFASFHPVGQPEVPLRTEHVPGIEEHDRPKIEAILSILDRYAGSQFGGRFSMADVLLGLLRNGEPRPDFYAGWESE